MTLTLTLTPELLAKLSRYAQTVGKRQDAVVAEMIATLPEPVAPPKERVLGRYAGQMWMSEDFNDELPDAFWFPDDKGESK